MISILYFFLAILHPLHVSVTEIEYSEKNKSLQIISRVFVDDLELSIREKTKNAGLDILNPKTGTTDQWVKDYLLENFKIKLDGKLQTMNYLGHEVEEVAIICYIEIENVKKFKTIEISNTVITEMYNDQSNLVHVTYKGPIKSMRLMKDKPSDTFTFDEK